MECSWHGGTASQHRPWILPWGRSWKGFIYSTAPVWHTNPLLSKTISQIYIKRHWNSDRGGGAAWYYTESGGHVKTPRAAGRGSTAITQVMSERELKLLQRITHLPRALRHNQPSTSSTSTLDSKKGHGTPVMWPLTWVTAEEPQKRSWRW